MVLTGSDFEGEAVINPVTDPSGLMLATKAVWLKDVSSSIQDPISLSGGLLLEGAAELEVVADAEALGSSLEEAAGAAKPGVANDRRRTVATVESFILEK